MKTDLLEDSASMGSVSLRSEHMKQANFRLCNVTGYMTELLELQAENPEFHVLFIPGNPGIVQLYEIFLETLYEQLGGKASITGMPYLLLLLLLLLLLIQARKLKELLLRVSAIGHICHTRKRDGILKDWEQGRVFSLEEQILHKMDFKDNKLETKGIPIVLVGHSIGAHMSLEIFKRAPRKEVVYYLGLYPFLAMNAKSLIQTIVGPLSMSPVLSLIASLLVALMGLLPVQVLRYILKKTFGKSWTPSSIDLLCTHLLQYHLIRNSLFMTKTEFEKFTDAPDWDFMRAKRDQIAFLFSTDDHWGPLSMLEEISKQVPGLALSIEREGHTHGFECSEAGSLWVAHHTDVCYVIRHQLSVSSSRERLNVNPLPNTPIAMSSDPVRRAAAKEEAVPNLSEHPYDDPMQPRLIQL
ncbi:Lipid droplet-associated hydrolase-like protein [Drosera capensis]